MNSKVLVGTFPTIDVEDTSDSVVDSVVIPVEPPVGKSRIIRWSLPEWTTESSAFYELGKMLAHMKSENMNPKSDDGLRDVMRLCEGEAKKHGTMEEETVINCNRG